VGFAHRRNWKRTKEPSANRDSDIARAAKESFADNLVIRLKGCPSGSARRKPASWKSRQARCEPVRIRHAEWTTVRKDGIPFDKLQRCLRVGQWKQRPGNIAECANVLKPPMRPNRIPLGETGGNAVLEIMRTRTLVAAGFRAIDILPGLLRDRPQPRESKTISARRDSAERRWRQHGNFEVTRRGRTRKRGSIRESGRGERIFDKLGIEEWEPAPSGERTSKGVRGNPANLNLGQGNRLFGEKPAKAGRGNSKP